MVGFGTSLRMARRTGWERAYLDYETLKMLLSQIEAVYEEEGHRQRSSADLADDDINLEQKDYRDELFIESDSDLAYASSDGGEELEMLQSSDEERSHSNAPNSVGSAKPFSLTYSHEAQNSSDTESVDVDSTCGRAGIKATLGWGNAGANTKVTEKRKKKSLLSTPRDEESEYFGGGNRAPYVNDSFILQTPEGTAAKAHVSSLLLQRNFNNENTALLSQAGHGPSNSGMLFYPTTPPRDFYDSSSLNWQPLIENTQLKPQQSSRRPTKQETKEEKLKEERRRHRRKRRNKLMRKKMERDKRVPRHIRVAHAKARSITERFLGLLRAEVEKVTLFTQSRLGELADTAGSLRFPSYQDSDSYGGSEDPALVRGHLRMPSFDNPLSDAGMHPSASSSDDEDEGRRGPGAFPWSDSSDDEENADSREGARSPSFASPLAKTNSGGAMSENTELLSNVSAFNIDNSERSRTKGMAAKGLDYEAVRRQISHFEAIRLDRPMFQRMDHIVGEDLLLLSAVDEADGYTAVGVELMHVLRFISVNVIAVRKICRKHDRLLMNRMLGGYYQRKRKQIQAQADKDTLDVEKHGETPNTFTLGGIVSRSLGDSNARQVFVTGINQNKLTGLYDAKIQQLANSNTVQVISSSIALALSEYEVTQSRADALAKLNSMSARRKTPKRAGGRHAEDHHMAFGLSPSRWTQDTKQPLVDQAMNQFEDTAFSEDSRDGDGPPSTASTLSLTRLRFTVVSIFALREVARRKQDSYKAFISRSSLVFTGANVIGEGLDGCSRDILDFFVAYSPDAAVLLDPSSLYFGLQRGEWKESPIGTVMLSTLAMGVAPYVDPEFPEKTEDVVRAVSVMPVSGDLAYLDGKHKIKMKLFMSNIPDLLGQGINPATLNLNSIGIFLYSLNYYIAHSTATAFVQKIGAHPAHSASIIGAASFGALVAALLQLRSIAEEVDRNGTGGLLLPYFRKCFLYYAVFPIVGNGLYATAVSRGSIALAVFGRFWIGFGSAEILHRQLLSSCLPAPHVVFESANLVHSQIFGVIWGLMIGGFLALFNLHVQVATISPLHSGSYFMAFCWFVHWVNLFRSFQESNQTDVGDNDSLRSSHKENTTAKPKDDEKTENSDEEFAPTPDSVFFGSASLLGREGAKSTYADALEAAYGSPRDPNSIITPLPGDLSQASEKSSMNSNEQGRRTKKKRRHGRALKSFFVRLRKVLFHNVGIPVTLALILLIRISNEIFFTSCAIITNRYFGWNGSQACFLLGLLSATVLPINLVVERISRSYDERTVIKRSIVITIIGLCVMVNYVSFINLMIHIRGLFERVDKEYHPYDWIFGSVQYVCGLSIAYGGMMSLEPISLSLMSKLAPSRMKSIVVNSGTIVTVLSLVARCTGDLHILITSFSHRLINTDIVNSLVVPLIVACLAAAYIVRRHFFFLI